MIWVTYEKFDGYTWETYMESFTIYQYENLKKQSNVVIIKTEKINIVSY